MLLVGFQHESMHTLVVSLPLCFTLFVSCVVAFVCFFFNSNSAMTPACPCNLRGLRGIIRQILPHPLPLFGWKSRMSRLPKKKTKTVHPIQQPILDLPSSRHLGRQQAKTTNHPPSKKPKACEYIRKSSSTHKNNSARKPYLRSPLVFRKPICGDRS